MTSWPVSRALAVILSLAFADVAEAASKTYSPQEGSFDWLDGSNWAPPGIPDDEDDVTIGSNLTANLLGDTTIRNLVLDSGKLDGDGDLAVLGRLTWIDGGMDNTFGGTGTTNIEQGMEIPSTPGTRLIVNRVLNLNGGVSTVSGASGFGVGGTGVVNLAADAVLEYVDDGGGMQFLTAAPGVFNIAGTFRKAAGNTGTTRIENIELNNAGSFEVLSGVVELGGTGTGGGVYSIAAGAELRWESFTYTLQIGSQVTGAGKVLILGNIVSAADWDVATTEINGGELSFATSVTLPNLILSAVQSPGLLSGAGTITVQNLLPWTGGGMVGPGVTNIQNGMQLSEASKDVTQRTLNLNGGTTTLSGGRLRCADAAFNNSAVFEVVPGTNKSFQGTGTFNNTGTFRALDGIGFDAGFDFNNSGTVEVGANVFMSVAGDYVQLAGTTRLVSNSTLTSSTTLQFGEGGTLEGSGTLQAMVMNGGRVSPGLSAARLIVAGDYVQTNSAQLAVEIGGKQPYTEFDALEATGQITLAGALQVSLINGFVPVPGDEFAIVFAGGGVQGDFDSEQGLVIGNGLGFRVQVGQRDVVLRTVFEDCDNSTDDDGDGNADCADPKCGDLPACIQPSPTPTATATPTDTPTNTPTATPTRSRTGCVGDCNHNGVVDIVENITAVELNMQNASPSPDCPAADAEGDDLVSLAEVIQSILNALHGCP